MRGKKAPIMPLRPDEVYGSELVSKFINYIMQDGQKQTATKIVYLAIEDLADIEYHQDLYEPLELKTRR